MSSPPPLLNISHLPAFDRITPKHLTSAITDLLSQADAVVRQLENPAVAPTWENFAQPLEDANEYLGHAWGMISHLHHVVDTPELRAAYNENQPKLVEFWTKTAQNPHLFEKYLTLASSAAFQHFTPARQRVIENILRDFRLSGAQLPEKEKAQFAHLQEKHAKLTTRFSENVLDATHDYQLTIQDEEKLRGLPEDSVAMAKETAATNGQSGYQFTLHFPSYFPLLQYAENRALRETIYRAYITKASELAISSQTQHLDNTQNIVDILVCRQQQAALLGFPNFATLSLVPKMAPSAAEVLTFLETLACRSRPFAEKDAQELKTFAHEFLQLSTLEAWDLAYATEKLRQYRYAFSVQEVKKYFPIDKVIEGLLHVIHLLFSVDIIPDTTPTWHPDVRFFKLMKEGKIISYCYMDLHARPGKRSGAWMDAGRSRRKTPHGIQTPIAYLICNFPPQQKNHSPVLLTHDEVITLFHECGHGLHHMLTEVDELGVSGIAGVEWDAVELPSQFMENFCWEWEVLVKMTAHVDTGKPLPRYLFDKMIAAKNFQSGLQTLRQVELALIDMHLHNDFDLAGHQTIQMLIDEIRQQVAVLETPPFNRFQHSFTHIFAGGYAAGYYSYQWAEMLSADAYSTFEKKPNVLCPDMGKKFHHAILAVGGSRPAMASFKAFRGREPTMEAWLRHHGMAKDLNTTALLA